MSSDLILEQITAGGTGPVLVADFLAFSSAPRLSDLISSRIQGRPVYQLDPLGALSGDRAYVSLADLAAQAAQEFGRPQPADGPVTVIGYCSAAALSLHLATLLARSAPTVAVLLRPSWPDAEMITAEFATLLANLRSGGRPSPVLDGDPGEVVTSMEQALRADIAAMAASQGLEGEESFAELLMTYRSWLGFLLACRNDPRSAWADGGAAVTVLTEFQGASVPGLSPGAVRYELLPPAPDDKNPVSPAVVDLVIAQVTSH